MFVIVCTHEQFAFYSQYFPEEIIHIIKPFEENEIRGFRPDYTILDDFFEEKEKPEYKPLKQLKQQIYSKKPHNNPIPGRRY